ncbi:g6f-like [Scleropages formosus]|uniref:G6f-like n=1 Tax=Scleropages formosus TaxID=113540 RepID=A0A8C9V4Y8_SCLFO|nr:uncharacterized protein LOC108922110 [Scleropages formosus]
MNASLFSSPTAAVLLFTGLVLTEAGDWHDVVVATEGAPVLLACSQRPPKDTMEVHWQWKPHGGDTVSLVLSANERQEFLGEALKTDVRLADSVSWKSGNFSLFFRPRSVDGGHYMCLIKQGQKKLKEEVTVLVILTVSLGPRLPVSEQSTLRLQAEASSRDAVSEMSWLSPHGLPLRCETLPSGAVIAKLPLVTVADRGNYTCRIRPRGNCSRPAFFFLYPVTVDVSRVVQFNLSFNTQLSKACLAHTPVVLSCAPVRGDYVLLYWQHPDSRQKIEKIFTYDRWRQRFRNLTKSRLHLKSSASLGDFSFELTPQPEEGGVYICEVFLNDSVFSQGTRISVLHVSVSSRPSALTLTCRYSERSQVKTVTWTHENRSRRLDWSSLEPGSLKIKVETPPGPETAGNYTCTLELNNGKKLEAVHVISLPRDELPSSSFPSPSSLPFLGFLLPVITVAAGVLLWKLRAHNARRGIEQSLSYHTGEVENIYENPEDLRQTQSSVYMDLKPTSDNDVYKELDRYEHCPC